MSSPSTTSVNAYAFWSARLPFSTCGTRPGRRLGANSRHADASRRACRPSRGRCSLRSSLRAQAAEVEVSLQMREKPEHCSSGYLLAFIGAGLTSVATILAFSDLGELVAAMFKSVPAGLAQ